MCYAAENASKMPLIHSRRLTSGLLNYSQAKTFATIIIILYVYHWCVYARVMGGQELNRIISKILATALTAQTSKAQTHSGGARPLGKNKA